VTWTYVVTNTGDTELTDIQVTDDRIGTVACEDTTLAPGASTTCTATGIGDVGQYTNHARVTGVPSTGGLVQDTDLSHYLGETPGIVVEKWVEGVDADEGPGPFVPEGDQVEWTYDVTNGGNVPLEAVTVTDDDGLTVSCPQTTLAVGETMRCTATGPAERGEHENVATATGVDDDGDQVSATDPAHYFGFVTDIDVEKATNGEDADAAPGPLVPVGDPVEWTYVVTNPGNVPLLDVTVVDDQGVELTFVGGDENGDNALDPGETWTYTASGTAAAGQYVNVASATGHPDFEVTAPIDDSDPSHHFGAQPGLTIAKDVDSAVVSPGTTVTYTITVTNTGNVPLEGVVVTDEQAPECDREIGDLAAGETVTYTCQAVIDEPVVNVAEVEGTDVVGETLVDEDDAAVDVVTEPPTTTTTTTPTTPTTSTPPSPGPDQPGGPDRPGGPGAPGGPDAPGGGDGPGDRDGMLPITGASLLALIIAALVALAVGVAALRARRAARRRAAHLPGNA
jgi:uncharacterized repeat protein (TIGR01451 family)